MSTKDVINLTDLEAVADQTLDPKKFREFIRGQQKYLNKLDLMIEVDHIERERAEKHSK